MFVGTLQIEVVVPGSTSLKDKRRVVKSIKDRIHREHQVSVAEVAALDHQRLAVRGSAGAAASGARCSAVLDRVVEKLRGVRDAEIGVTRRVVSPIEALAATDLDESGRPRLDDAEAAALVEEMLAGGRAEPPGDLE